MPPPSQWASTPTATAAAAAAVASSEKQTQKERNFASPRLGPVNPQQNESTLFQEMQIRNSDSKLEFGMTL